ncbi:hypothetical protein BU26DRAFT_521494 [Trematosphaeria pertusa]|uniref:20S-pre-rRNA D-site endonuclease NOB1 n=1 Tax=Trematosphaeria pertusa TaxID=390896 RepID=A0A6A6I7N8_9PLEO|nr:uncharacterized protein BU26DRAFT_521494 [Trematosphaeria pertusa]KAF2245972.1 hypothetical protein BU26DRAFT_521494 [Trematosphaeria pertusa]
MASQSSQKPIHSIIIDTGPLIKNAISISTIVNSAEELYTTPAIISEIRDAATRSRVETTLMPFLNIRTPSPASYEAVAAFAKKTGDFAVLSKQDLGILALAYEVHCESHGGPWGLRNAPGQALTTRPMKKAGEKKESENDEKQSEESQEKSGEESAQQELESDRFEETPAQDQFSPEEKPLEERTTSKHKDIEQESTTEEKTVEEEVHPQGESLKQQTPSEPTPEATEATSTAQSLEKDLSTLHVSSPANEAQEAPASLTQDDDSSDGEWITPTNLAKHQAKAAAATALATEQTQMSVATMTTDFAMQNVLLQMNLNLLSTNMQRIKKLKTHILRCHACFFTTKQMDKQFCPRCGQATLNRVSCTTNAKGEFMIHLAKNYQYNNRGNRYSVPKPIAGTSSGKYTGKGGGKNGWGRDLVFAEDQKEYVRQIDEGKRHKAKDLMDEDYLPRILTGDRGRVGGRPKVGAGRNINSRKRF